MARSSKSRMSVFQADDSGASPERAAPPNALADERRSFKPEKQVRFLTGAPTRKSESRKPKSKRGGPPNALADERRSLKPEKQVRYLTGAPIQLFAASGIAAND